MCVPIIWPAFVLGMGARQGASNTWEFWSALLLTLFCCAAIWWRSSIANRLYWNSEYLNLPTVGRVPWQSITEAAVGESLIYLKRGKRRAIVDAFGLPGRRESMAEMT